MPRHPVPLLPSLLVRRALRGGLLASLIAVLPGSWAGEPPRPPDFQALAPLPAIQKAAEAKHIPLAELQLAPSGRETLRPGDTVTALVSVVKGKTLEQHVITLTSVPRPASVKKEKVQSARYYTSTGHAFELSSAQTFLEIGLIGPLAAAANDRKVTTAVEGMKRRVVGVAGDYLSLGLDRMPAMALRVEQAKRENPDRPQGNLQINNQPFPADVVAKNREAADAAGITEADERAVVGGILAMIEFFQIAARTPGLQDVLEEVIDIPWWSIIRSGGKMPGMSLVVLPGFSELPAADWGLAGDARIYGFPLQLFLNEKPALLFQLAVTAPRPPWQASAGVIGLAAGRPDGKGPQLHLRIVAARAAEEKTAP